MLKRRGPGGPKSENVEKKPMVLNIFLKRSRERGGMHKYEAHSVPIVGHMAVLLLCAHYYLLPRVNRMIKMQWQQKTKKITIQACW